MFFQFTILIYNVAIFYFTNNTETFNNLRSQRQMETKKPEELIEGKPSFAILHFNDVYDIQEKKGKGGIANFQSKVQQLRKQYEHSLLLFSGDAFSPSILSPIKEGWQMVTGLNFLGVDAACYGNHQFDYEPKHTLQLAKACNFPWLLGNIFYSETRQILGEGLPYVIKEVAGLTVGIFGVGGQDWIHVLSEHYEGLLEYEDCEHYSNRMAQFLKEQENCDFIVALTHMRNSPDLQMAANIQNVDIILGGHDHVVLNEVVNKIPVVKSGCNFHHLGLVEVFRKSLAFKSSEKDHHYQGQRFDFNCQVLDVPQSTELANPSLVKYVAETMEEFAKNDKLMGYTECDLNAKFCHVRTQETNYGNFVADLVRLYNDCEIALVNSGSIRNDAILPVGELKYSRISNIIDQNLVIIKIKGSVILEMLEYSVSGLPDNFSGSFLLVSGIKFEYDLDKTPRVQKVYVGEFLQLDPQTEYLVATADYLANGGDGFTMLKGCEKVVDEVHGIGLLELMLKFFQKLDIVQDKFVQQQEHKQESSENNKFKLIRRNSLKLSKLRALRSGSKVGTDGKERVVINPKTNGRIVCLTKNV